MTLHSYERDLAVWIPILIRLWRARSGAGTLPADRLSPAETQRVARAVRQLTQGFGGGRTLAGGNYLNDPDLLGAYLLYFWPVSYVQARFCLDAARSAGLAVSGGSWLDVCAGPGPLSCALFDIGATRVVATDKSASALAMGRIIAESQHRDLQTREWNSETPITHGDLYDGIVMGHGLNELWKSDPGRNARRAGLLRELCRHLTPNGMLLIVEPALKEVNRELLDVRNDLVRSRYRVVSPCFFSGDCPALADPSAMCYASYPWSIPGLVADIARAAGPDKSEVKMSYLCVQAPETAAPATRVKPRYRVLSDHMINKAGRHRIVICGAEGRFTLSTRRGAGFPAEKEFFKLKRGDAIEVYNMEVRGDNRELDETTLIRLPASPDSKRRM